MLSSTLFDGGIEDLHIFLFAEDYRRLLPVWMGNNISQRVQYSFCALELALLGLMNQLLYLLVTHDCISSR